MSAVRLVGRSGAARSPGGGRSGRPRWWWTILLGPLIGLAVALLLGGCAAARVPTMVQTDEARCGDRGGYWTEVEGTWHCLARRP